MQFATLLFGDNGQGPGVEPTRCWGNKPVSLDVCAALVYLKNINFFFRKKCGLLWVGRGVVL